MKLRRLTFALLVLSFVTPLVTVAMPMSANAVSMPTADDMSLLSGTNSQRDANGIPEVRINDQLTAAAEAKAADMVAKDYWAHVSPTGEQPWDFISASGYNYTGAGENLAYGYTSMGDVITGWMNSPPHRETLLKAAYIDVGFAVVTSPNYQGQGPQTIVVGEFGMPASAPAPSPVATVPTAAAPVSEPASDSLTPSTAAVPTAAVAPAPTVATTAKPVAKTTKVLPASTPAALHAPDGMLPSVIAVGITTPSFYLLRRRNLARLSIRQVRNLVAHH